VSEGKCEKKTGRGHEGLDRRCSQSARLLANPERFRTLRRMRRAAGSGACADARQGLTVSRAL
jgi:hypothetical protein